MLYLFHFSFYLVISHRFYFSHNGFTSVQERLEFLILHFQDSHCCSANRGHWQETEVVEGKLRFLLFFCCSYSFTKSGLPSIAAGGLGTCSIRVWGHAGGANCGLWGSWKKHWWFHQCHGILF